MKPIKKQRHNNIQFIPAEDIGGGNITFDKSTGQISITDKNNKPISLTGLKRELYYIGETRRVLLSRLIVGEKLPLNGIDDLDFLATYDQFYIIDTNKLEIKDKETHHITSFIRCSVQDIGEKYSIDTYERVGYFHFFNLKHEAPEKVGWINLFNQSFFIEDLNAGLITGIIVDAHLDELENYNSRVSSILKNHYLPRQTTLMYAKADKSDTIVNKLIKASDKLANLYKKDHLLKTIELPVQEQSLFKCEKYWFVNEKIKGMTINPSITSKPHLTLTEESKITLAMHGEHENGEEWIQTKVINLDQAIE